MKQRRVLILSLLVVALLVGGCGLWVRQAKRQYTLNRELIAALENDDDKQALALVNAGADPNARATPAQANSPNALMLACGITWTPAINKPLPNLTSHEDLPLVQAMLTHRANLHARTLADFTPLHCAAYMNRARTVELLLQQGADVNAQDQFGHTALMMVTLKQTVDVARLLLAAGANPNMQDCNGNTALHWAIHWGNQERLARELVAHGADFNLPNKKGITPLQVALRKASE